MVRSIQEMRALRGGTSFKPYAVGECWDSERRIDDCSMKRMHGRTNPVGALDFRCAGDCVICADSYGFSLRNLTEPWF